MFGDHDFNPAEKNMVDSAMLEFQNGCDDPVDLEGLLLDNEVLRTHPMFDSTFVRRGCRRIPYAKCDREFRALYAEREAQEQSLHGVGQGAGIDWTYPPNFDRLKSDPSYWGLPAGSMTIKRQDDKR